MFTRSPRSLFPTLEFLVKPLPVVTQSKEKEQLTGHKLAELVR